jgi:hypothetical protein
MSTSSLSVLSATVKLTVSLKRKLGNGDEIFMAPGIEIQCAPEDLDAKQVEITDRVHGWLDSLTAEFPDPTDDAEEGEAAADDDEEAPAADDDDEGEGLTAEDIDGMDKKALIALIEENELEIEGAAKMKVADLREAVKEAAGLGEDAGEEDESSDDDEDGEDAGEEADVYTAEDLKTMKLVDLQAIVDAWEIAHPTIKKGADTIAKKAAYVKYILAQQEEE